MRKRMYRKGRVIRTMSALCRELDAGRYVFMNHKPQNPGWVISMQFRSVTLFLKAGRIWKALKNA